MDAVLVFVVQISFIGCLVILYIRTVNLESKLKVLTDQLQNHRRCGHVHRTTDEIIKAIAVKLQDGKED